MPAKTTREFRRPPACKQARGKRGRMKASKETNKATNKFVNKQRHKHTLGPTNEKTNKQTNKQTSKQPASQPTNQPASQPASQPSSQPASHAWDAVKRACYHLGSRVCYAIVCRGTVDRARCHYGALSFEAMRVQASSALSRNDTPQKSTCMC